MPVWEEIMSKTVLSARHRVAVGAALASVATLASPIYQALGAPPVDQVNVVNPATSPVPTTVLNPATSPVPATVLNPATMPALTSSVDDPGRIAYQSFISTNCPFGLCDEVFFPS